MALVLTRRRRCFAERHCCSAVETESISSGARKDCLELNICMIVIVGTAGIILAFVEHRGISASGGQWIALFSFDNMVGNS